MAVNSFFVKNFVLSARAVFVGAAIFALSACTAMPVAGPYPATVRGDAVVTVSPQSKNKDEKREKEPEYALVYVNDALLSAFEDRYPKAVFPAWPKNMTKGFLTAGVGDIVSVTLYESRAGGLFIPAEGAINQGNFISLPPQTVDQSGLIIIPYAGAVQAAGKSANEISREIVSRLENLAIQPQAVVGFSSRGGSEVSVLGEVRSAQRYSLNFNGEKILDAISRAGGPSAPGYEVFVTLHRDGVEYTVPFDYLVLNPEKNLFLEPGDTVYLYREPENFLFFGAAGFAGKFNFGRRVLTLAEAIGEGNGLNDTRADPSDVYVYRYEDKDFIASLDPDVRPESLPINEKGDKTPVVYKFDLREAGGMFLTQKFALKTRDVVYAGNAELTEFLKFLNIVNPSSVTTINTRQAND